MAGRSDDFDPGFGLAALSRAQLARLGREYLMLGHLHDRVLMPILGSRFGPDCMGPVAIDEWMGSSPIYNARNRELLGIRGDGVSVIFKSLQLDVGAPHQYMDFRFEVIDESLGYFWLERCGAYDDVKRMAGENPRPIVQMCHEMEDPTFDATAMAVNPRARCRPVHRPPLPPEHRGPVCRWEVRVAHEAGVLEDAPITQRMRATRAARFRFAPIASGGGEGLDDYAGPFRPDFQLEDLSQPALVRQCQEFALDVNLLVRASQFAVLARWGPEVLREVAALHWAGVAPLYVQRIRAALELGGDDMAAILQTLQLDPSFPPEYARCGFALEDARTGWFWLTECEALDDGEPRGWLSVLDDAEAPGLSAVVAAVNPRARAQRVEPSAVAAAHGAARIAFRIDVDPAREPLTESNWTRAGRVSSASSFRFREPERLPLARAR